MFGYYFHNCLRYLQPLFFNKLLQNCLHWATTAAPRSRNTGIKKPPHSTRRHDKALAERERDRAGERDR